MEFECVEQVLIGKKQFCQGNSCAKSIKLYFKLKIKSIFNELYSQVKYHLEYHIQNSTPLEHFRHYSMHIADGKDFQQTSLKFCLAKTNLSELIVLPCAHLSVYLLKSTGLRVAELFWCEYCTLHCVQILPLRMAIIQFYR